MEHRFGRLCRLGLAALCCSAAVAGGAGWASADGTESGTQPSGADVTILMYHSILPEENGNCYCLSEGAFRSDLEYLKAHSYETIFVSDLVDFVRQGRPLPEKPVVITLDDGYLNGLTAVLPILEELDMKATISVVGCYTQQSVEEADPNPYYAYLTWEDIRTLDESGRVEIGSHTYAMHELNGRRGTEKKSWESTSEYQSLLRADLEQLQGELAEKSGVTPQVFAYPYGFVSPESREVMEELGFTALLTCCEQVNHLTNDPEQLYNLGRYNRPSGISTQEFMARVGLK